MNVRLMLKQPSIVKLCMLVKLKHPNNINNKSTFLSGEGLEILVVVNIIIGYIYIISAPLLLAAHTFNVQM